MKKNIRNLVICMLVLVMTMSLFAGCEVTPAETTAEPTETQEPTEPAILDYVLFYDKLATKDFVVDEQTGAVLVKLYTGGKQSSIKFASIEVAEKMRETTNIFAVTREKIDGATVVTSIQTVEELGAKYVAKQCYITKIEGDKVYANTSADGLGWDVEFTMSADTEITDTTTTTVGLTIKLREGDCVTAVANAEGTVTNVFMTKRATNTKVAHCQHCDQEVTWTPIYREILTLPTAGGHYFLADDTGTKQCTLVAEADYVLDLNGHTLITSNGARTFSLNNANTKLAIMDTSEAKTGTIKGAAGAVLTANGAVLWGNAATSVIKIYSGTIDASETTDQAFGVALYSKGTVEMYGGKIIGGTSKSAQADTTEKIGGGAVYLTGASAVMTMTGGEIIGGKALDNKDTTVGIAGRGGAVYMGTGSKLVMTGGSITGGEASLEGPCVWQHYNATIECNGGTIQDIFKMPDPAPVDPAPAA